VDGVALDDEAYVFPSAAPQKSAAPLAWRAPLGAALHVVTGLARGARYTVALTKDGGGCKVAVTPASSPAQAGEVTASQAGLALLRVKDCALGKNP
jgi:hypothetical protein